MKLNYKEILIRIEDLIFKSGLSVHRYERESDLPTSSINAWQKGRSNPSLESLVKICNFSKVSLDYLIFGDTETQASFIEKHRIDINDNVLMAFIKFYYVMSERQKDQAFSYMLGLLDASGVNTDAILSE